MNSSQSDELDCSHNSLIKMKNNSELIENDAKKLKEINEERINLIRIINTFKSYADVNKKKLNDKIKYFESLPPNHQKYLAQYKESLEFQLKAIDINYEVIRKLATDTDIFENDSFNCEELEELLKNESVDLRPEPHFHDKIPSIMKQIVREWSVEGEEERRASFSPIIEEINQRFEGYKKSEVKILVPGAGLGRLSFEIARRGYFAQGNEYSLFMLFTSNFILNKAINKAQFTIYPYLHNSVNNYSMYDQTRAISFPDCNLSQIETNLSMVGGNFIEVYDKPAMFDCVATCFFIDTTHNVLDYVEKIFYILKPGGFWINLGPLLYHYADTHDESIEPSYDLLKHAIQQIGFEYVKEKLYLPMQYTQNSTSMLIYHYRSIFFVCEKKPIIRDHLEQ